jgi:hypothetical protein
MVIKVYKQNVSSGNIGVNVAGANTTSSSFASLSNTFNSFANNMFNQHKKLQYQIFCKSILKLETL